MSASMDLSVAFDDCVERLRRGESLAECLTRYPQWRSELEPMLQLAMELQALSSPPPARAMPQRSAARAHFLAEARRMSSEKREQPRSRIARGAAISRWASIAAALVVVILFAGGAVIASASSLPGDLLYPLKLTTEQVQLLIVGESQQREMLQERFEERRREEVRQLTELKKRAAVTFPGTVERVTPGSLRVSGLDVLLTEITEIQGAIAPGVSVSVSAVAQEDGSLVGMSIVVVETPTPTPVPTQEPTATFTPVPTPTPTLRPLKKPTSGGVKPVVPTPKPPTPVPPSPTPTPAVLRRLPTPTPAPAQPVVGGSPTPTEAPAGRSAPTEGAATEPPVSPTPEGTLEATPEVTRGAPSTATPEAPATAETEEAPPTEAPTVAPSPTALPSPPSTVAPAPTVPPPPPPTVAPAPTSPPPPPAPTAPPPPPGRVIPTPTPVPGG